MKTLSLFLLFMTSFSHATHENILKMQGCFDVTFEFKEVETRAGSHASTDYFAKAKELVVVEKNTTDEIHLQHILITRGGIIKHWRQEWYNASNKTHTLMSHTLPNTWEAKEFSQQENSWIQYVGNTDDAPRYSCAAVWIGNTWSCTDLAPLPRREYTKRNDYNMMNRGNLVEVTEAGWVHAQDNQKLLMSDVNMAMLVGREIGKNTYSKINDEQCAEGLKFWEKRRNHWFVVQEMWRHIFVDHNPLKIDVLKGEIPLSTKLDEIVEFHVNDVDLDAAYKKIKKKSHDAIHEYFL
jgi:hypothetical protein